MKKLIGNAVYILVILTFLTACGDEDSSNGGGETSTPPPTGSIPSAPTGISASAGNEQVTISWSSVSGADSYNIYWAVSSGVTKVSGTKVSGVTSPYIDTGRTNDTTYYYVVTAINTAGESGESTEVSATPSLTPPPPPPS